MSDYFASLPASDFFWWSAIPALLAAAAFVATFVFVYRSRLIENMPTSRLRSAAQGYIEIEGCARLMPGPLILCPLTTTTCVWWRYKVEEKRTERTSKGSRTSWVTIDSGLSDDCFEIDDGTGKCVVDPTGASVIPTQTHRWYGHRPRPDVGYEHGRGFWRAAFCTYRYTEELILADNEVYALGSFRTQSGGPDAFDEQADLTELLTKWKHDRKMMALFDVNKDGNVDMKEWEAARRMAKQQVQREHVERAVNTPDVHVFAKPKDRRPFVISGIPQEKLVRRFRWYATGCLAGTVLAASFLLWVFIQRGIVT